MKVIKIGKMKAKHLSTDAKAKLQVPADGL